MSDEWQLLLVVFLCVFAIYLFVRMCHSDIQKYHNELMMNQEAKWQMQGRIEQLERELELRKSEASDDRPASQAAG